jgi:hypothetical protein
MQDRIFLVQTEQQRGHLSQFVLKQSLPFQASLGPLREQRSIPQNARYWKIIQMAAQVVGCSAADLHEDMLCEHYGATEVVMPSGAIRRIPVKRSSTRDKKEFRDLMEFVEIFVGQHLGVWLPE